MGEVFLPYVTYFEELVLVFSISIECKNYFEGSWFTHFVWMFAFAIFLYIEAWLGISQELKIGFA